jgi:RHS repeat-associated protein
MQTAYTYDDAPRCASQFTGKERDAESGLDNFGARHAESALGRFLQVDPTQLKRNRLFEPQRLNLYAHSVNNPLSLIDPDGKDAIAIAYQDAHYHGAGAIFGNSMWPFGHAGIVTVDSKGHAIYFDKNQSGVHKEDLGPVKLDKKGIVLTSDLAKMLQKLDKEHGDSGGAKFAYFKADDAAVKKIDDDATKKSESKEPYDPLGDNCTNFVEHELQVGGLITDETATRPNAMFGDFHNTLFTGALQNATENSTHSLSQEMDETVQRVEESQ